MKINDTDAILFETLNVIVVTFSHYRDVMSTLSQTYKNLRFWANRVKFLVIT